jgi:hypothetical protein
MRQGAQISDLRRCRPSSWRSHRNAPRRSCCWVVVPHEKFEIFIDTATDSGSAPHGLAHPMPTGDRVACARNYQCRVWTLLMASSSSAPDDA